MRILTLTLALSTLFACVEDVGKDKPKAAVADVPEAAADKVEADAPAAAEAPTGTALTVDPAASSVSALGAKITATHPIDFKTFTGTVTIDGDAVTSIAYEVQMKSLEADVPKLTTHLLNEDFFHVEKYPTSVFQSVSITTGSEVEGYTHTVVGDLTIKEATKRITFPAKVAIEADKVQATTEFVLDRQDFGVTYPGRPDDLVQDNVRMNIDLVATR